MHATSQMIASAFKIVFYMRTIQERQEILEIAGRENGPRCYLQIDKEIRWFNANIFRKNHAKYFRPMES
jgi:hypothetical protein